MRSSIPALFGAFLALSSTAGLACDYPADIKVPNGKTATDAEMTAARDAVKKYMADMDTYMDCIDKEAAALPADQQTAEQKALTVKRHNAAVDAEQNVANQFNDALRAFKAAKSGN